MASIFRQAITTASRAKKLKAPSGDFESVSNVCDKHAGTGYEAGGLTQRGSGADDGIYFHDSQEMPVSSGLISNLLITAPRFLDLSRNFVDKY